MSDINYDTQDLDFNNTRVQVRDMHVYYLFKLYNKYFILNYTNEYMIISNNMQFIMNF